MAHAAAVPVSIHDVQSLLEDWNLKSTFGQAFKKFEVDGEVFMDLQPADFEDNAQDFPNARDYHWRKLLRLRRDLLKTETRASRQLLSIKKPDDGKGAGTGSAPPAVKLDDFKGVSIESAKAKVSFGDADDVALYYNEKGKLKLKGELIVKGQSLESMIRSTCKQVLGSAIDDGEISGPVVNYVETGKKSFSCTGKDQYFTVPEGVTKISAELKGAAGGGSFAEGAKSPGGDGGVTKGSFLVKEGQVITIQVGCGGSYGQLPDHHKRPYPRGGLPGYRTGYNSGAGGGRSAILMEEKQDLIGGKAIVTSTEYLLVAGGGGGAGGAGCGGKKSDGGKGGGNEGERGYCSYDWYAATVQKRGCVVNGDFKNGGVGGKSNGKAGLSLAGADASQHVFNGNNKGNAAGGGGDGWFGGGAAGEFKGSTGDANLIEGVKVQPHYHCGGGGGAGYVNPDFTLEGVTLLGGGGKGNVGAAGSPGGVTLTLYTSPQKSEKVDKFTMSYMGNGKCADSDGKALSVGTFQAASTAKKGTALTKDGSCWRIGWDNLENIKERGATTCEQCLNSVEGRSAYKGQQCVPVKPFKDGNGNIISCERPGTASSLAKDDKCKVDPTSQASNCDKLCAGDDNCYGYVTTTSKSGRTCALITQDADPKIQGVTSDTGFRCFVKAKRDSAKAPSSPVTTSFGCVQKDQVFTVPKGVKYIGAVLKGAGGGSSDAEGKQGKGGDGGFTSGTFAVTPGQTIGVEVGCGGTSGQTIDKHKRAYPYGGLPGYRNGYTSGGGGGRSSIFTYKGKSLIKEYLLVAGGGGGSGGWGCGGSKTATRNSDGGSGGGDKGHGGFCVCGKGGAQAWSPGKALQGSDANQKVFGSSGGGNAAGGGGDGWQGGKFGGSHCGGGGGSGYVNTGKMVDFVKSFTGLGGGAPGGPPVSGGRPGSHGAVSLTFFFTKPSKSCDKPFSFANCAEVKAHGCKDGTYKLRSCDPSDPASCTSWQTKCEGGRTLLLYLAKNTKTKQRYGSHTSWPKQSLTRATGSTFLFQGDLKQLAITNFKVYEGVKCTGTESFENNCKWVHSTDKCGVDCLKLIVQSMGYQFNGDNVTPKRPPCANGKVGGTRKERCQPYTKSSATVLGWAVDMHGTGNCWMGRGTCCSDAGGTGACDKGDSNGQYHGMLWVEQA